MPFSSDNARKLKPLLRKPLSLVDLWVHSSNPNSQRHCLRNAKNNRRNGSKLQIPLSKHRRSHSHSLSPGEGSDDGRGGDGTATTSAPSGSGSGLAMDPTALLSDSILLRIFSFIPQEQLRALSVVCKRWLVLHGQAVNSLRLLDWSFLLSGRFLSRFTCLTALDLIPAFVKHPASSVLNLSNRLLSLSIDPSDLPNNASGSPDRAPFHFIREEIILPSGSIDAGLCLLARGCPNLRMLSLIYPTEIGLSAIAADCRNLQELELHRCNDQTIRAISACKNLKVLRVTGSVEGVYHSLVSDIGLTILAHAGKQLKELDLSGCEGSYAGISAIGKCCSLLEELTVRDHRMDGGWIAALAFFARLRRLRLVGCKHIDEAPGSAEHLASLPKLEVLHLKRCQLRDKQSVWALFMVCNRVCDISLENCWGFDNDTFGTIRVCRMIKSLSLRGCSLLTTEGLESVLICLDEIQTLSVISCNSMKDSEITPALSNLFAILKGLTWRPDSRSILPSSLTGSGMWKKGVKYFKI